MSTQKTSSSGILKYYQKYVDLTDRGMHCKRSLREKKDVDYKVDLETDAETELTDKEATFDDSEVVCIESDDDSDLLQDKSDLKDEIITKDFNHTADGTSEGQTTKMYNSGTVAASAKCSTIHTGTRKPSTAAFSRDSPQPSGSGVNSSSEKGMDETFTLGT